MTEEKFKRLLRSESSQDVLIAVELGHQYIKPEMVYTLKVDADRDWLYHFYVNGVLLRMTNKYLWRTSCKESELTNTGSIKIEL